MQKYWLHVDVAIFQVFFSSLINFTKALKFKFNVKIYIWQPK